MQLPPQREQQSIHVTKDSDTFHSLHVTGMHDPRLIKNSILRKLGLEGGCDRYLFYHENGKHSGNKEIKGQRIIKGESIIIIHKHSFRYCFERWRIISYMSDFRP